MSQFHQNFIATIIDRYGLALDGHQVETIIATWLQKYDAAWIIKAIVESLYRGRYKIVSVDNILRDWARMGKPRYNFTPEYEREILQKLPDLDVPVVSAPPARAEQVDRSVPHRLAIQPSVLNSKNLNPEESAPFQRHDRSMPTHRITNGGVDRVLVAQPTIASEPEDRQRFIALPPSSLAILEQSGYASSRDRYSNSDADGIFTQPANQQLFKTLKAIVDPHDRSLAEVHLVFSPVCIDKTTSLQIAQLSLPIEIETVS
jgi:hypothetical protein